MDSWSCGVWRVVRPAAPERRVWEQGKRKEEADCGLCQPWTSPFREPTARGDSLQPQGLPYHSSQGHMPPGKPLANGRLWQGCWGLSMSAQSGTPLMGTLYAGPPHPTG